MRQRELSFAHLRRRWFIWLRRLVVIPLHVTGLDYRDLLSGYRLCVGRLACMTDKNKNYRFLSNENIGKLESR